MATVDLVCEQCSASFSIKSHRAKGRRFCSLTCFAKHQGPANGLRSRGNKYRLGMKPTNAGLPRVPWNKGKRGIHCSPRSEFKPGRDANNRLPVGTIRERRFKRDGSTRAFVKVAEPNRWELRARLVWIDANGPIAAGMIVHHKNRNTLDDSLDNLELVTRAEHLLEHRAEFEERRRAGLRRHVDTPKSSI